MSRTSLSSWATGRLTITSDSSLNPALIKRAVEDAGYRLAAS